MGPGAGRLHGPLSGAGRPPPSASRDVGGRRVGGVRRRRPARSAVAVAPARVDRSVADSPSPPLVFGAVRVVRPALSCGTLPVAGAVAAAAGSAGGDVPTARRGRRAVLGRGGGPREGVVRGRSSAGSRRRHGQAPSFDLPARRALRRVAEDQASAAGDLSKARDSYLLIGRCPASLRIHLCSVNPWVNLFRGGFRSPPRSGPEKSPRKLTMYGR